MRKLRRLTIKLVMPVHWGKADLAVSRIEVGFCGGFRMPAHIDRAVVQGGARASIAEKLGAPGSARLL
jgi:hypothetical protein